MTAPDWTPERIAKLRSRMLSWCVSYQNFRVTMTAEERDSLIDALTARDAALSTATERIAYLTRENGRLREREAAWVAMVPRCDICEDPATKGDRHNIRCDAHGAHQCDLPHAELVRTAGEG